MECRLTSTAAGVLGALGILVLMMGPETVQAKVSDSTGTIQGRAPTATGSLLVQAPDGNVVNNNDLVDKTWVPNNFTASADTTELTLGDLDGDCAPPRLACTTTVNTAAATRVWKYNGNAMTEVMLSSPFQTYFSGKAVTVTVSAPVTTTSTTGAPVSGTQTLSSSETTVVVPLTPGILVGAPPGTYRWDVSKKFPTTAALGLKFTVNLADGNGVAQTDFNWSTNQPSWTSVDSGGVVTFTAAPTSATRTVTITATSKANSALKTLYTFTMNKWFATKASSAGTITVVGSLQADMSRSCQVTFGAEWRVAQLERDVRVAQGEAGYRVVTGRFAAEWGAEQPVPAWRGSTGQRYVSTYAAEPVLDNVGGMLAVPITPNVGSAVVSFPVPSAGETIFYSNVPGAAKYFIHPDGYAPPYLQSDKDVAGGVLNNPIYTMLCVKDI